MATELTTARLTLRSARVSNAPVQRELWSERDPRAPEHRRIDADGHPTIAELEERIRAGGQPGLLMVSVDGDVIGYCGLIDNVHGQPDEPEIAYELLQRAWGNGYATEAAQAVIELARESGYRRLWATVRDWNTASRRVLAKLGFVETDRVDPDPVHGDSIYITKEL